MVETMTSQEIVKKAEECYSLGLITEDRMEWVVKKAMTQVGYDPVIDLPFDFQIEHEKRLRREAARRSLPWWKRWL